MRQLTPLAGNGTLSTLEQLLKQQSEAKRITGSARVDKGLSCVRQIRLKTKEPGMTQFGSNLTRTEKLRGKYCFSFSAARIVIITNCDFHPVITTLLADRQQRARVALPSLC